VERRIWLSTEDGIGSSGLVSVLSRRPAGDPRPAGHKGERVRFYLYTDAATLLSDFWRMKMLKVGIATLEQYKARTLAIRTMEQYGLIHFEKGPGRQLVPSANDSGISLEMSFYLDRFYHRHA
jgi:hypothetical protein